MPQEGGSNKWYKYENFPKKNNEDERDITSHWEDECP